MTDIIIQGALGHMGRTLTQLIQQRDDCRVVAGIDRAGGNAPFPVFPTAQEVNVPANVVIDFSLPEATAALLPVARQRQLPCVVCTTGLPDELVAQISETARHIPVFRSANMSLGINLMARLITKAREALPRFDIEIIEKHHRKKVDAPSGTAMMLADTLNETASEPYQYVFNRHDTRAPRQNNEIGLSAVRGGTIVGEHEVLFAGPDEVFTISHTAYSKDVFANGAIAAALYLAQQPPGLYNMQNLLEEV